MKKERFTTPIGEAKWAHVQSPKTPFTDDRGATKGEPKYQIDVVFAADDPAWKSWAGKVMAQIKDMPDQIDRKTGKAIPKQIPIKKEFDQEDKATGRYYVTFKTSDKFKPGVFDKYGVVIPETVMVGNGSKVRVNYCENVYEAFGGGINFYLNAVQVLELVEYKPQTATAYGFEVENPVETAFPMDGNWPSPAAAAAPAHRPQAPRQPEPVPDPWEAQPSSPPDDDGSEIPF